VSDTQCPQNSSLNLKPLAGINHMHVKAKTSALSTFSNCVANAEFWLTRTEPRTTQAWRFDVRLFVNPDSIFLEISNHPPSVEQVLSMLLSGLRQKNQIDIEDDDGMISGLVAFAL
jgi:hypothetical protein